MDGNKIVGGNPANERRESDFYPTPKDVTVVLIQFLENVGYMSNRQTVWEPACGQGDMAQVFRDRKYEVITSDINQSDACDFTLDFTRENSNVDADWIITNPPFSLAEQFIRKAHDYGKPFAMLLKSQYWHASRRYKLFEETKPTWILPLTWRPDCTMGGKGSPLMDVLWTVWYPTLKTRTCEYVPLLKPLPLCLP